MCRRQRPAALAPPDHDALPPQHPADELLTPSTPKHTRHPHPSWRPRPMPWQLTSAVVARARSTAVHTHPSRSHLLMTRPHSWYHHSGERRRAHKSAAQREAASREGVVRSRIAIRTKTATPGSPHSTPRKNTPHMIKAWARSQNPRCAAGGVARDGAGSGRSRDGRVPTRALTPVNN